MEFQAAHYEKLLLPPYSENDSRMTEGSYLIPIKYFSVGVKQKSLTILLFASTGWTERLSGFVAFGHWQWTFYLIDSVVIFRPTKFIFSGSEKLILLRATSGGTWKITHKWNVQYMASWSERKVHFSVTRMSFSRDLCKILCSQAFIPACNRWQARQIARRCTNNWVWFFLVVASCPREFGHVDTEDIEWVGTIFV